MGMSQKNILVTYLKIFENVYGNFSKYKVVQLISTPSTNKNTVDMQEKKTKNLFILVDNVQTLSCPLTLDLCKKKS